MKKEMTVLYEKKIPKKFTRHCKTTSFMYEKIKGMIFNFFFVPQILDVVLNELIEF